MRNLPSLHGSRRVLLASPILAGCALAAAWLLGAPVQAGGDKKKEKEKDSFIQEVGGKTLEVWIKDISHKDPGRRATAISFVLEFGPDRAYQALPAILEQLKRHVDGIPVDLSVRVNGATALGLILGNAKAPEGKHIRDSVNILKRLTLDTQSIVKYRAVQALGQIGEEAADAVPNVLPLLKDPLASEVRQAAATTLGRIALDKEKGPDLRVLGPLFNSLNDPAAQVRLSAIQSLTWLGAPADAKAKAQLLGALQASASKDAEATIQVWAHMAIMSITHTITPETVAPIIKMLDHADVPVRLQAAQALGTIGPKAKSSIPALMLHLSDKEPAVIVASIWALSRMEDNAASAIPMLTKISADMEQPEIIQEAAKEAVKLIQKKGK